MMWLGFRILPERFIIPFNLHRGNWRQLLGWKVLKRGLEAGLVRGMVSVFPPEIFVKCPACS